MIRINHVEKLGYESNFQAPRECQSVYGKFPRRASFYNHQQLGGIHAGRNFFPSALGPSGVIEPPSKAGRSMPAPGKRGHLEFSLSACSRYYYDYYRLFHDIGLDWRRGRDSNSRSTKWTPVFKTGGFNRSPTPPIWNSGTWENASRALTVLCNISCNNFRILSGPKGVSNVVNL